MNYNYKAEAVLTSNEFSKFLEFYPTAFLCCDFKPVRILGMRSSAATTSTLRMPFGGRGRTVVNQERSTQQVEQKRRQSV